ncbi:MAG: hypothetical protein ACETV1_08135 [Candidatus Bathyarchaeia archaeon]
MNRKEERETGMKCGAVQTWFEGVQPANRARNKSFTLKNFGGRLSVLDDYVEFSKMNPDQLLDEGKEDIVKAYSRLMDFYNWLQTRNPEGEELPEGVGKRIQRDSAVTIHGLMRGFYTHNRLSISEGM